METLNIEEIVKNCLPHKEEVGSAEEYFNRLDQYEKNYLEIVKYSLTPEVDRVKAEGRF